MSVQVRLPCATLRNEDPMLGYIKVGAVVLVWIAAAFAAWVAFVPATISAAPFIWLNAATAAVIAVAVATTRSARPTRSVAHVLYDVENPSEQRR